MSLITLLTDLGTADGYVPEMKGVLATHAPFATVMDLSHDIAAHDVDAARLTVARFWRRFPIGTVHCVVVDPGVGSARAALAVHADGRLLVGPDNGVLSPALLSPGARAVALEVPAELAPAFHGRDVFAPAAARMAGGVALESLGEPVEAPVVRRTPEARRMRDGWIEGVVLSIDRFGNAITNVLARGVTEVRVGDQALRVVRTYAALGEREVGALSGSSGLLELSMAGASAAARLGLSVGTRVRVWRASDR
ncbi:MAG: SAM-dependent chlorinase/fluorinase [Gemmatimonadaceae bacterium]|jgi:hypothetical protein|nr:SAM-dependent chlorinase/fluorinase [Gemmatimonadaceae bacterium]